MGSTSHTANRTALSIAASASTDRPTPVAITDEVDMSAPNVRLVRVVANAAPAPATAPKAKREVGVKIDGICSQAPQQTWHVDLVLGRSGTLLSP